MAVYTAELSADRINVADALAMNLGAFTIAAMIELRDFVSETIKQVIDGAISAQEYAKEKKAVVNPKVYFSQKNDLLFVDETTNQPVQSISFDVAVTASEGTKTQGGIAVFTGVLGLGSKGQSDRGNESVNRIQFSVPISLPIGAHKNM